MCAGRSSGGQPRAGVPVPAYEAVGKINMRAGGAACCQIDIWLRVGSLLGIPRSRPAASVKTDKQIAGPERLVTRAGFNFCARLLPISNKGGTLVKGATPLGHPE
jgi:hypothetical protein